MIIYPRAHSETFQYRALYHVGTVVRPPTEDGGLWRLSHDLKYLIVFDLLDLLVLNTNYCRMLLHYSIRSNYIKIR